MCLATRPFTRPVFSSIRWLRKHDCGTTRRENARPLRISFVLYAGNTLPIRMIGLGWGTLQTIPAIRYTNLTMRSSIAHALVPGLNCPNFSAIFRRFKALAFGQEML